MDPTFGKYVNPVMDIATHRLRAEAPYPMLVVGTDGYVAQNASWMWNHDVSLFYLPSEEKTYSFGVVAVQRSPEGLVYVGGATALSTQDAVLKALDLSKMQRYDASSTRLRWVTRMMRSCPKVGLTDLLHLQPFKKE